MDISPSDTFAAGASQNRNDLLALIRHPNDREQRPCPDCTEICSCQQQSVSCCCQCSIECPAARRHLSSDGERYPIEKHAVPLVYALNTLGIVQPCWSCEGHADRGNEIQMPQVWFYSVAAIYAQLAQRYLNRLMGADSLISQWEVTVCAHQPEAAATLFVIRPVATENPHLGQLQRDVQLIGRQMAAGMRSVASELLQQLPEPG